MVTRTDRYEDIVGPATVSVEHALAESFRKMRELAAEAGTDDFYENWSREVLDRRPLIVVAAVMERQTITWVMEPGIAVDSAHDGLLSVGVDHVVRADGKASLDVGLAMVDSNNTKTPRTIAEEVSWLVKESTGEFLPGLEPRLRFAHTVGKIGALHS